MNRMRSFPAAVFAAALAVSLLIYQHLAGQANNRAQAAPADLPFSATVTAGGFIFASGQIGLVPETGKLAGDDIESQTAQALANLDTNLRRAGTDLSRVVKTTVFLARISDYDAMNVVYKRAMGANRPARSTVAVAGLARGALIEIEAIAVAKAGH
ncbi:MAG: Rid family detoxifying hydrolase [Candidatus Glassbacteria bacterium]